MLKELRFVIGSVSKKDFMPALSHFKIQGGRVQGFNGRIALSSPIEFDIDCIPKADTLVKAVQRCEEAIVLGMTPTGRLSIKSGKFRTYITCVDFATPHKEPEGEFVDIDGELLLKALSALEPIIANDASRLWSNGVRFDGSSAFATNNVILAEYWLGADFPISVVIPRDAVKEILRINETPIKFQMSENSLTLHYEDGRWLSTLLIVDKWPDVRAVLNKAYSTPELKRIPEEFWTALEAVKPFTDKTGRVMMEDGVIHTHIIGDEEGSEYDCPFAEFRSTYVLDMLTKLEKVATHIDLSKYPNPAPWQGENLRGAIIGLRWLEGRL